MCFSFFTFSEQITFSANGMKGQAGSTSSTTTLTGSAFVKTDTMEIAADIIELSGEDFRNITASGNVSGCNLESKMSFTCDILEYDRKSKIALLRGNVELVDIENEVNAKAQIIEYNQEKDIAILQIEINLLQKDNICTGAYGIYQKKAQLLEISGNAQVKQKNDTFRAQQITLNLETQDISMTGNIKGSVEDVKEKEDEEKALEENQVKENETPKEEVKEASQDLQKNEEIIEGE